MNGSLTVALAQTQPVLGNVERNLRTHERLARQALDGGADLVVFPELSLNGYIVRDLNFSTAIRRDDARLDALRDMSAEITIVLGGIEEDDQFGVYNAAFVIDDGSVTTYRKVYPPDYGIFEEGRYFLRGSTVRPIPTRIGPLGVLVCEDLWHPSLALLHAYQGARMLVVLSASPRRMPGKGGLTNAELNTQHHAALCRLLSQQLVFVNRVGFEDGVNFWGSSQAVDAFGNVLVRASEKDEELLFVELHDAATRHARQESRHFLDDDPWFLARELGRILREREGG
jgi:predicted amidohydrolase